MCLLSGNSSNKVAVAILKLLGTIGSPGPVPIQTAFEERPAESIGTFSNASFYADFTLNLLVPLLESTASPVVFTAVTSIIARGTEQSIKYIGPILTLFRKALESETDFSNMFKELEVIVYYCGWPVSKYIDQFEDIFKRHLLTIECLNLCITLSFQLRSGFAKVGSSLYPLVLIQSVTQNFFTKINPSPEPLQRKEEISSTQSSKTQKHTTKQNDLSHLSCSTKILSY